MCLRHNGPYGNPSVATNPYSIHLNFYIKVLWIAVMQHSSIKRTKHAPPSPQCLSQDLEAGCLKLAVVKVLGVQCPSF